jgi:thiol:disulfide interchange protein DsbC
MDRQMKHFLIATFTSLFLLSGTASAEALSDEELKKRVNAVLAQFDVKEINDSPIPGLKEIIIGTDVIYATADGKHVIQGSVYNIENGIEDITEASRGKLRKGLMAGITDDKTISFGKSDLEDTVTVFTDIDCPYCVKLHNEMDQYNKAGIRVRYLFFPRAGLRSPSYTKAVSVWCAEDQKTALTMAKNGAGIEEKSCDNPIKDQYILGREVGVTGTPAIMLESGEMLPGYIPADKLKQIIEKSKKS